MTKAEMGKLNTSPDEDSSSYSSNDFNYPYPTKPAAIKRSESFPCISFVLRHNPPPSQSVLTEEYFSLVSLYSTHTYIRILFKSLHHKHQKSNFQIFVLLYKPFTPVQKESLKFLASATETVKNQKMIFKKLGNC